MYLNHKIYGRVEAENPNSEPPLLSTAETPGLLVRILWVFRFRPRFLLIAQSMSLNPNPPSLGFGVLFVLHELWEA